MTHIEQEIRGFSDAFDQAISAGYVDTCPKDMGVGLEWHYYTHDPLFWQALGKARGWKPQQFEYQIRDGWNYHWHRFIDALAEGKSAEDFFATLLT